MFPCVLFITYSCAHSVHHKQTISSHNIESILHGFDSIGDTYRQEIFVTYGLENKNHTQIIEMYGIPDYEFTDTLRYGNLIKDTAGYYYPFKNCPYEIDTIPELILYGRKWELIKNKVLTVYFVNDSDNKLQPIYGNIQYYTEDLKPFWILEDKDLPLQAVIKKRGKPQSQSVEFVEDEFGSLISFGEDICNLDILPTEIHTYIWDIDSGRYLFLYYTNNENMEFDKPIWGFQCSEEFLMYE